MAKRFARRHLVAEKFNEEKALQKMKETCQWRKEHSLDDLRLCFFSDKEKVSSSSINEDQRERISMFEKCIELELGIQESYMISYDRYGAAVMVSFFLISIRHPLLHSYTKYKVVLLFHTRSEGVEIVLNLQLNLFFMETYM